MRLLIADGQRVVRHGLKQVLLESGDVDAVDELEEGREVIRTLRESEYDALVLDTALAGRGSTELLAEIRMVRPGLPVLLLSHCSGAHSTERLRDAGALGTLTKAQAPEHLLPAIRAVMGGGTYFMSPDEWSHPSAGALESI